MSRLLRVHLGLMYAFLFLPIGILVVLSFNESGLPTSWGGFRPSGIASSSTTPRSAPA